jgi:hypothetical protein
MTTSRTGPDDLAECTRQPNADAGPEALLDLGVELTFPASDPIAVQDAFGAARRREQSQQPDQEETHP